MEIFDFIAWVLVFSVIFFMVFFVVFSFVNIRIATESNSTPNITINYVITKPSDYYDKLKNYTGIINISQT